MCGVVCCYVVAWVTDSITKPRSSDLGRVFWNISVQCGNISVQRWCSEIGTLARLQVAKVISTVKIGREGGGGGGAGGWLPTSSIFIGVGATGSMSSVTCNAIYFQHLDINIFAWLYSECGTQYLTVSISLQLDATVTAWLVNAWCPRCAWDCSYFNLLSAIWHPLNEIFWEYV